MRADIAAVVADFPATLTWGGQTVACVISPEEKADDVQDIGEFINRDLEAVSELADWTDSAPPANRQVVAVTYAAMGLSGVNFRIESQTRDDAGITMRLRRI